MLEIACMVEPGTRSPANDDRVAVNKKLISSGAFSETVDSACLVIVCDGVGGEAYGHEAAEIVTRMFSHACGVKLTVDLVNKYIDKANEYVMTAQKKDKKHSRMSTTIAGLYINGDDLIAFNVGDSRIYRYRNYISQISKDHSKRQEQIDLGCTPKKDQENIITRYIGGMYAVPEIVEGTGRVFENDIYVLCSDGVWGVLEDDDFEKILSEENILEKACHSLIDLALKKGSKDNLSIIMVKRV